MSFIEGNPVPFAVYQLIDERVATIGLSAGFCGFFGFKDLEEAFNTMDNDMYHFVHEDDKARVAEAALVFLHAGCGSGTQSDRRGVHGSGHRHRQWHQNEKQRALYALPRSAQDRDRWVYDDLTRRYALL